MFPPALLGGRKWLENLPPNLPRLCWGENWGDKDEGKLSGSPALCHFTAPEGMKARLPATGAVLLTFPCLEGDTGAASCCPCGKHSCACPCSPGRRLLELPGRSATPGAVVLRDGALSRLTWGLALLSLQGLPSVRAGSHQAHRGCRLLICASVCPCSDFTCTDVIFSL